MLVTGNDTVDSSVKRKLSNNIYEIYVDSTPPELEWKAYREDYFSFTLIGFNSDDIPFNLSIYDSFKAQMRVSDERNPEIIYEFTEDEFVLGKTDVDQDEFDELHLVTKDGMDFADFFRTIHLDVQAVLSNEKNTLYKLLLTINPDVTR